MKTELLLSKNPYSDMMMGNSALVRAMIESNTRVVTSYPGSPTPEIADTIAAIPREKRPFYFEYSINEKVATEVAFGASINGHLSVVFFKSVGLNVAADTFVQLSMMELIGGMIIILGDDPGANSSQNEQDNRHYAKLSLLPVFEPATPEEAYLMFLKAAWFSKTKKMAVILRMTTHVCHAKERIHFNEWVPETPDNTPRFDIKNGPYIPITSLVFPLKKRALMKLESFREEIDVPEFNQVINNNSTRGIITAGMPYLSILEVMESIENKPDVLKLDLVFPIAKKSILDFLKKHREIKIIEELDPFLEDQIKALAFENSVKIKITGKLDLEDMIGEYTPHVVDAIIRKSWPDLLPPVLESKISPLPEISPRPAQLCPGCGHRSAFFAVKNSLEKEDITVNDIGCYSLGFLPPYEIGNVLLCMGHSSGTSAGLSLFNSTRRVIAFIGDSTFFHAGLQGILNAVFNNHNFTLIVMENGTTAMTGHQDNPVSGKNFNGVSEKIPIKRVLEAFGVKQIHEIDAYSQKQLSELLKTCLASDGFKVIIAKHPCMLKFVNEKKRQGKKIAPPVKINELCEGLNTCISEFGCPTFQFDKNDKVWVQNDLCIGDKSCLQTCSKKGIEGSTSNTDPKGE